MPVLKEKKKNIISILISSFSPPRFFPRGDEGGKEGALMGVSTSRKQLPRLAGFPVARSPPTAELHRAPHPGEDLRRQTEP